MQPVSRRGSSRRGGGTNSRPTIKFDGPTGGGAVCADSGIDTVRFRFRHVEDAYEGIMRHPTGAYEGPRGERWRMAEVGRVGVYPDGMAYVEARAAALVEESNDCHDLLPVGDLALAERAARAQLHAVVGSEGGEHAALGRIDLAGELRFSRGDEGVAFLHAVRAVDVPWGKTGAHGMKGGSVESVSVVGTRGRSVHLRVYDKGVEAGTDGPGRRVRFERQKRARKEREQTVAMFAAGDLRREFLGRLRAYENVPTVVIADAVGALDTLREHFDAGRLNGSVLERLTGYVLHGGVGLSIPTQERRRRELRDAGVAFDPLAVERTVVPVGRYLRVLASAWEEAA